jgi:hypothetical protein
MHPNRILRLIAIAVCTAVVVSAPSIWFARQRRQLDLNHALIAAIKQSDAAKVASLLADGANPNTRDTPEAHESLLERLKNLIHPPPDLSPTALLVALTQLEFGKARPEQTLAIVTALLSRGANANAQVKDNYTPIGTLMLTNHQPSEWPIEQTQLLNALLAAGANIEARDPNTDTALLSACLYHRVTAIRILLNHGANIGARDGNGYSPLMMASMNDAEIVRILLDHGANTEPTDSFGSTPLMLATENSQAATVRLLLDHGANANPKPTRRGSPLSLAQHLGLSDVVKLLKAHGAKP